MRTRLKCYKCGKEGHKAAQCQLNQSEKVCVTNGNCNHCGKAGHVEENCWKKYPHLIPELVKLRIKQRKSETAGAASGEIFVTCVKCSSEEPNESERESEFEISNEKEESEFGISNAKEESESEFGSEFKIPNEKEESESGFSNEKEIFKFGKQFHGGIRFGFEQNLFGFDQNYLAGHP